MTSTKKAAIAAATILAVSPLTAAADGHWYLGASVGSASLAEDFDGFDIDADSTALRLVGGWQFNDYFSLEGGYHNFGSFEQSFDVDGEIIDASLEADGFTLGATGTMPLGGNFSLYGRAGSFFWDGDAEINNVSQATPEDTNLYLGIGASYALGTRLSIVADWSRYALEDTESDVASLGLTARF